MATDSTPSSRRPRATARAWASSSGRRISPFDPTRSSISRRNDRGIALRALPVVPEEVLPPEPTHLERVAKSPRAQQCGAREPPLDQRVGDDGRAVAHLAERLIVGALERAEPGAEAFLQLAGTVGTFPSVTVPDATSRATRSVNVPPMSTPTIAGLRGHPARGPL